MKSRFLYGYIIVAASFFVLVAMNGSSFSYGVFFKPMSAEFGWSRAATSGAYSLSLILAGFLYTVTGRLTDQFGPRLVLTVCGLLFGTGYMLVSRISAIWHLYIFWGIILGLGLSGGHVPSLSTVARWFDKRRGLMCGIAASGIGIGTVFMPPFANYLVLIYGWRTSFLIIGTMALLILMTVAQFLKLPPAPVNDPPDGGQIQASPAEIKGLSLREVVRSRQFWFLCIIFFSNGFNVQSMIVHGVAHATDLGISATAAAFFLTAVGGFEIVGTIVLGTAIDRMGSKRTLIAALALLIVAMVGFTLARQLWLFYLAAAVLGVAYGGIVAVEPPIIAELFGLKSVGAILGLVLLSVLIGGATGPLVAGRIYDITQSYTLAFLTFGGFSSIALVLASTLKPRLNAPDSFRSS